MLRKVEASPRDHLNFQIKDGRRYKYILRTLDFNDNDPSEEWKLCIPKEERIIVLLENHYSPSAGYLGVAKTLDQVGRYYFWPGMFIKLNS